MSTLLNLAKIAITTKDKKLRKELKKIFKYVDGKGCKIYSEILNHHLIVYDVTNLQFLSRIDISYLENKLNII